LIEGSMVSTLNSPSTILLVEDDPMMQLGLEQALGDYAQFSVIGRTDNGLSGVEMALKPDVVVMDIGLPRLDGIAATERIKTALPQVRIVMLTSHTAETEILAALSSGADAYCIKGVNVDRLVAAIEAAQDGAVYLDPQIARRVLEHLKPPIPRESDVPLSPLSQRETDVLRLIVRGFSNPEIASELFLSPNTIKTHIRGIMNKLAVDDRVQAAVVALRTGLV
jgi:two-component system, NarL family, response regulator LiaR